MEEQIKCFASLWAVTVYTPLSFPKVCTFTGKMHTFHMFLCTFTPNGGESVHKMGDNAHFLSPPEIRLYCGRPINQIFLLPLLTYQQSDVEYEKDSKISPVRDPAVDGGG